MPILAKQEMFRLSTNERVLCPLCRYTKFDGSPGAFNDVSNHILQEHKLKCIHVGQETTRDDGQIYHHTVAVFGK